jgi:acyl-CoA-binding protein
MLDYAIGLSVENQHARLTQGKIMADLQSLFAQAQADVKTLDERPDNQTLLQLYALFKQATEGDASGERPGMMDFINRAKFDAWEKHKGMSAEAAMQGYVDLVKVLMAD